METENDAPLDYAEFYEREHEYTVSYIRKFYQFKEEDAEDLASDIMVKFIERDFLTKFDPSHGVEKYDSPTPFRSFWTGFVKTYMMGFREREQRRSSRYPLIFDQPANAELGNDSDTIGDYYAPFHAFENELVDRLDYEILKTRLANAVKLVPGRKDGTVSYEGAFKILSEVLDEGAWKSHEIGAAFCRKMEKQLGVSSTTSNSWKHKLFAVLQESV